MAAKRSPSRQKLIKAALDLFASQGITETTTRQIAERAGVNEVTLFRQFGNKHGLLLAAIEEAEVFASLARTLAQEASQVHSLEQALRDYADARLEALESMPEFVRSLVGEAGQYPKENRQSLGRELTQANRFVAQYLVAAMEQGPVKTRVASEKFASLLNSLLLGYAVLEFTSEFHQLWDDRQDFLDHVVSLFLHGAVRHRSEEGGPSPLGEGHLLRALEAGVLEAETLDIGEIEAEEIEVEDLESEEIEAEDLEGGAIAPGKRQPPRHDQPLEVADLPAGLVHEILKQAKADGSQSYGLIYLLFATGISGEELIQLRRHHYQSDRHQHILHVPNLHVPNGLDRLVPLNQWILGKRYGTASKTPLSQWLKSRKDDSPALFIAQGNPSTDARSPGVTPGPEQPEPEPPDPLPPDSQTLSPLTLAQLEACWARCTAPLATTAAIQLRQAQDTWRVEMLMRGMSPENLSLLTGTCRASLEPYLHRANLKRALEQAQALDRKSSRGAET